MNFGRTLFILPNLFTLTNVFCGFFAIALCAHGSEPDDLYQASLAICFGFFFDLFDGRLARLTKTQSRLGMELDSLADMITFGAAPALLVYKWGLTQFGLWGIFVSFLYLGAAAFRLARYNILSDDHEQKHRGPRRYYVGLSTPAAAGVIVALVMVHHKVGGEYLVTGQVALAILVVILAYLMISRVRFRTFRDVSFSRRTLSILFLISMISLVITVRIRGSFVFVFLIALYLGAGLTEEVYRYAAERRAARRAKRLAEGQPIDESDADITEEGDEEVLRELGAEDEV